MNSLYSDNDDDDDSDNLVVDLSPRIDVENETNYEINIIHSPLINDYVKVEIKFKSESNKENNTKVGNGIATDKKQLNLDDTILVSSDENEENDESDSNATPKIHGSLVRIKKSSKYLCKVCNKKFKVFRAALNHQKHPIDCDLCKKKFCNQFSLGKHMWKRHPINEHGERFYCFRCNKNFINKVLYDEHEYYHAIKESPSLFFCDICNMDISNLYLYEKHVKQHQREVYKCTLCYKGFTNGHRLEAHLARDCDKVRTFTCRICAKHICSPVTFRYHMNKHNDEKPYQCETCMESFTSPCQKHSNKRKKNKKQRKE